MEKPRLDHKPDPVPFEVGAVFQISDRGAVALAAVEPQPWWPLGAHRVRIAPPAGAAFEADAIAQPLRSREGGERLVLLLVRVQKEEVPPGSRIVSLGHAPRVSAAAAPAKRWWQFWK